MPEELGRATAGQLRRAGFTIEPANTDDSATTGFETRTNHADDLSIAEHAKAKRRGDHLPAGKA